MAWEYDHSGCVQVLPTVAFARWPVENYIFCQLTQQQLLTEFAASSLSKSHICRRLLSRINIWVGAAVHC